MFGSLITAIITPLSLNNEIDYKALKNIINNVYNDGSEAIVVGGSTGEGHLLTLCERLNLIQAARFFAPKALKVIASIGEASTKEATELLTLFNELDIDGILISAPHYVLPNQEGIFKHFKELDSMSKHPLILYNIPSRTGVVINKETVIRLRKNCHNIVAVKHASKDLDYINYLKENDKEIVVYIGNDSLLIEALEHGADGIISVGGNAFSIDFKEIIKNYHEGIKDQILENYFSIITSVLEIDTNPIVIKYIMTRKGLCSNKLRLPLTPLAENLQEKINILFGY